MTDDKPKTKPVLLTASDKAELHLKALDRWAERVKAWHEQNGTRLAPIVIDNEGKEHWINRAQRRKLRG